MEHETLLQRNLLALSPKDAFLSSSIARAEPSSEITMRTAKNGSPVPVTNGRAYHSLVNPEREGVRIASSAEKSGFLVVFGLGGGYHIKPLLDNDEISFILVIEKGISEIKTLLSSIDLREILLNPKTALLVDKDPREVEDFVLSTYFPAVTGDLNTLQLRSRWEHEPEYYTSVLEAIRECINTLSDDYTVQAYFGKKWFTNTLANLPAAEGTSTLLDPVREAVVTGAGPSLEMQLEDIRFKRDRGTPIIATDTSLSCLLKNDIVPDIVISIDCQHVTYHHFMAGYPRGVPLVLDLASPPGLTRLTDKLVFFTTGHPFSQYVSTHWRPFPYIDISGGNVSHAAVSLADSLGAKRIFLYGVDFSYPSGKSYARGTYLYPYFHTFQSRKVPLESKFYSFLLRNETIEKTGFGESILYTTKPMINYKKRLENACSRLSARVIHQPGLGVSLDIPSFPQSDGSGRDIAHLFSPGTPSCRWKEFLEFYDEGLRDLSFPPVPVPVYLSGLEDSQKDILTTLLPASAAFRRENKDGKLTGSQVLSSVREWSRDLLRHYLKTIPA
jgi:hypothetical protein